MLLQCVRRQLSAQFPDCKLPAWENRDRYHAHPPRAVVGAPVSDRLYRRTFDAGALRFNPLRARRHVRGSAPVLDMPPLRVLLSTLQWQAIALVFLVSHIILVVQVGPACFPLILVGLLLISRYNSLLGLIVYLQVLLYQNVAISLFSQQMSKSDYTVLSGTAFGGAVVMACMPVIRMLNRRAPPDAANRGAARTVWWIVIAIGVATAYAGLGTIAAGATPAAVGFRNATAMLLAVLIGIEVGSQWSYRTVALSFLVSMLLGLVLVVTEIADPAWYLSVVHAADFGNVKYGMASKPLLYTANDMILTMTSLPFNTDLLSGLMPGTAYRFGGPNMHSISYGYVLAVTELILLSLGWVLPVLPLLVLSFLIGVKGAAILFAGATCLYLLWRFTGSLLLLCCCGLVFAAGYVGFGISSGLKTGDFHVIGFLGGVNGFLKNPLGHGLGVGGNLSLGTLTVAQWQAFQHNGADVGLESAVGVLLYQMGVGCAAIVGAIVVMLRSAPFGGGGGRSRSTDILFIGLCIGLVNGVFQEEAYSPYAVGLLSLLCGVLIANGRRPARLFEPAGG